VIRGRFAADCGFEVEEVRRICQEFFFDRTGSNLVTPQIRMIAGAAQREVSRRIHREILKKIDHPEAVFDCLIETCW